MPIQIQFLGSSGESANSIPLALKSNKGLDLPQIHLVPQDGPPPQLSRVNITAQGAPPELVRNIEDAYKGYKDKEFHPPLKLAGKRAIIPNAVPVDPSLIPGGQCVLEVLISYMDSTAEGAQLSAEKVEKAKCDLYFVKDASPLKKVYVTTPELIVKSGPQSYRISIHVEGSADEIKPKITIKDAQSILHDFIYREVAEALDRASNQLSLTSKLKNLQVYDVGITVDLSDEAMATLLRQGQKSLSIPLSIRVPGVADCECKMKLVYSESHFPGWMAIDFGTSSSTVTLWDFGKGVRRDAPRGLSEEQSSHLRKMLAEWLSSPPSEAAPDVSPLEWEKFRSQLDRTLELENQNSTEALLSNTSDMNWHAVVRQIELCAWSCRSDSLRRAISRKLYDIYHKTFRIPSLNVMGLVPVALDADTNALEIPSELEIKEFGNPLKIEMGNQARTHRLATIERGSLPQTIEGRFIPSPKRYLRQFKTIRLRLNGNEHNIQYPQIAQAVWAHLVHLTEQSRAHNPSKISRGAFHHVLVTYPTVSPPTIRRRIKPLLTDLGIDHVQADYDEATAAAIFYLWQEFSGSLDVGLEEFKAGARRLDDKWIQNVLVIDIGGGTTDLALIEIVLKEEYPFKEGESRGAGGRYYKITPTLRRSSGNLHLGGELITLRTFLLLKAALVDNLLSLVQSKKLKSDTLSRRITELDTERFRNGQGEFIKGSIFNGVYKNIDSVNSQKTNLFTEDLSHKAYHAALNAAELALPTRWSEDPVSRLQAFYTLWECAEEAKIKLGARGNKDIHSGDYTLSHEKVAELLEKHNINDYEFESTDADLSAVLTREQFRKAAAPLVKEMVSIAKGMLGSWEADEDGSVKQIDWLILSGKSCNLEMIDREFRNGHIRQHFMQGRGRVTFVREYAKLATSIGAAFLQRIHQLRYTPENAKPLLIEGINQYDIDVKNLFYYLPCSFERGTQHETEGTPVFYAGSKLLQTTQDPIGKLRSGWVAMQFENVIRRIDYDSLKHVWGHYDANQLKAMMMERMPGLTEDGFLNSVKIEFEIDHELDIRVFLCQGNPHYLVTDNEPSLKLPVGKLASGAQAEPVPALDKPLELEGESDAQYHPSTDGLKLQCEIAVQVAEGSSTLVFDADSTLDKKFRYSNSDKELLGHISDPLPPFPSDNKHRFFARRSANEQWAWIGTLIRPGGDPVFDCQYIATIDSEGVIRVHQGQIPYWTTSSVQDFIDNPGCVLVDMLQFQEPEPDNDRDPFCGMH